jgi:hypothetical protein
MAWRVAAALGGGIGGSNGEAAARQRQRGISGVALAQRRKLGAGVAG